MIHIEFTQSPDANALTSFNFFQNLIYLGRVSGDLKIADPALSESHLMLEVVGNELLVHPQRGIEFYLLNGKRARAIRKLKAHDLITIGQSTFKILSFDETFRESKKDILNRKLNQLIEEDSPRLPVIERLSQLMK